jgi:hypothetical protein
LFRFSLPLNSEIIAECQQSESVPTGWLALYLNMQAK